jgi:hypothetical protein
MLYGAECWATKGQHIQKMSVAERLCCCCILFGHFILIFSIFRFLSVINIQCKILKNSLERAEFDKDRSEKLAF